MWDNRAKKTNPKAPDFRCKDPECKYQLDQTSGEYVESEYTTSVWVSQDIRVSQENSTPPLTQQDKKEDLVSFLDLGTKSMLLSYAKDIEIAKINNGTAEPDQTTETINRYKKFCQEIIK